MIGSDVPLIWLYAYGTLICHQKCFTICGQVIGLPSTACARNEVLMSCTCVKHRALTNTEWVQLNVRVETKKKPENERQWLNSCTCNMRASTKTRSEYYNFDRIQYRRVAGHHWNDLLSHIQDKIYIIAFVLSTSGWRQPCLVYQLFRRHWPFNYVPFCCCT